MALPAIGGTIKVGLAALSIAQPVMEVASARKQGYSTSAAIGRGLASYALFEMFPGLGFGMMGAEMVKAGAVAYKNGTEKTLHNAEKMYSGGIGGSFVNTQASYTMRQRGIQAIQNNGINARSVLGNEARMYVRGRYE